MDLDKNGSLCPQGLCLQTNLTELGKQSHKEEMS